jgi:HK97 gp10 family phage protein
VAYSRIDVSIEGGEELLEKLERIDADLRNTLRAATLAGAQVVADLAAGMAPGPEIATDVVEATSGHCVVAIGPDAEHWHYRFLETGAAPHEITGDPLQFEGDQGLVRTALVAHPGLAARPFLRPAHDGSHDEQRDAVAARLREAIP